MDEGLLTVPASMPTMQVQRMIIDQSPLDVLVWEATDEEVRYWAVPPNVIMELPGSDRSVGEALGTARVEPDDRIPAGLESKTRPADEIGLMVRKARIRARRGWASAEPTAERSAESQAEGPVLSAYAVGVEYPQTVTVGDPLSLLISISADLQSSNAIPFAGAVGDLIDIVVSPKRGFVVDGSAEARLTVASITSLPAQIRLKAVAEGAGEIICYAFRAGSPLGSLTIRPEVVASGQETGTRDTAEGTFPSGPKAVPADLELIVLTERDAAGQPVLRYLLNATDPTLGLNLKPFGPVPITGGPAAYFFSLFADISAIPVDTANLRRIAAERLTAIGSTLFSELFPDDLQALLWGLRDRIGSVLIQSEEPWVPWELCRLQGREDGRIVEGPFLCEAFDITRWMPGLARQPDLRASSIGVIQPPSDLASAPRETEMLQGLATSGPPARTVTAIPPNYSAVRAALGEATYEVVHFVGHGRFPDANDPKRAELSLTGTQALRPIDISGAVANLGLRRPIVFLNACQSGVKAVDLTGNGGWAVAMLEAGAGAFVGSHWDVTDSLALRFATEFYARLLAGDTIPAAVRAARLTIRDDGDPTWLAYTAYADPRAKLVS